MIPPNPDRVEAYSVHLPDTYNSTHRTEEKMIGSPRTRKLKFSRVKKRGAGDCCDVAQTDKASDRNCGT